MNEFDRFVRNTIKPLGYIRYGDDFVLITKNRTTIQQAKLLGEHFLTTSLKLPVHKNNNVSIKIAHGIMFLGHKIYPFSPISVDSHMTQKILSSINETNVGSYSTSGLPKRKQPLLPWLLMDEF